MQSQEGERDGWGGRKANYMLGGDYPQKYASMSDAAMQV